MIDHANPNSLSIDTAKELAQRVGEVPRDAAEQALNVAAFDRTIEPFIADLLDAWERHIVPALKAGDPAFCGTDRQHDSYSRLHEMGPSGMQVLGYLGISLGGLIFKSGLVEELDQAGRDPDSVTREVGRDLGNRIEKFFRRPGDSSGNLLARNAIEAAFGPALIEALREGFVVLNASEAAAED